MSIEDKLRMLIGSQAFEIARLQTAVEQLQAQVATLTPEGENPGRQPGGRDEETIDASEEAP